MVSKAKTVLSHPEHQDTVVEVKPAKVTYWLGELTLSQCPKKSNNMQLIPTEMRTEMLARYHFCFGRCLAKNAQTILDYSCVE